jgi:hypothetical protein
LGVDPEARKNFGFATPCTAPSMLRAIASNLLDVARVVSSDRVKEGRT